ncbi:hypothetical protein D3C76_1414300 [compost metagenome]
MDGVTKGFAKQPLIMKSLPGRSSTPSKALRESAIVNGHLPIPFVAPTEAGVYNLSFDIEAVNENGEMVTRSVNYNFAVTDEQGNINN